MNDHIEPASLDIACANCKLVLAKHNEVSDDHSPGPEALHAAGAVPVPNFGWFCGQSCANAYGERTGVSFQRNAEGKVSYY